MIRTSSPFLNFLSPIGEAREKKWLMSSWSCCCGTSKVQPKASFMATGWFFLPALMSRWCSRCKLSLPIQRPTSFRFVSLRSSRSFRWWYFLLILSRFWNVVHCGSTGMTRQLSFSLKDLSKDCNCNSTIGVFLNVWDPDTVAILQSAVVNGLNFKFSANLFRRRKWWRTGGDAKPRDSADDPEKRDSKPRNGADDCGTRASQEQVVPGGGIRHYYHCYHYYYFWLLLSLLSLSYFDCF